MGSGVRGMEWLLDSNYGKGNTGSRPWNDGIGAGQLLGVLILVSEALSASAAPHPPFPVYRTSASTWRKQDHGGISDPAAERREPTSLSST